MIPWPGTPRFFVIHLSGSVPFFPSTVPNGSAPHCGHLMGHDFEVHGIVYVQGTSALQRPHWPTKDLGSLRFMISTFHVVL